MREVVASSRPRRGSRGLRTPTPYSEACITTDSALRAFDFVGGEWVSALDGAVREIVDPATEKVIASVPESSEADVDRAVGAARRAAPAWARMTPGERSTRILALADKISEHADELAQLESRNVGKPLASARSEMDTAADDLRFFAGAVRTLTGQLAGEYLTGYSSMLRREPIGVVGLIAPWNYPLLMAIWKLGPSLAAGNAVVLKPSEHTPLTALRLAELSVDILPPGVLNVITGDGVPAGASLVRHPAVGMVSLTGDVATGKEVAKAAADSLKRVHLELGGKAPVLVLDDADVDVVVQGLRVAGFVNAGQDCTAACRVIAGSLIHDRLLDDLIPAAQSLQLGNPANDNTELGPLITAGQRKRVLGFVDRAVDAGAQLLTGGTGANRQGFFVEPTVITGVEQRAEIVQREVFGPVITVQRAQDFAEAIALANDVEYGLGASVWTQNLDRAMQAARELRFGSVWINDHNVTTAEMPFGGYQGSGYGRDLSMLAIEAYTEPKHVMVKI